MIKPSQPRLWRDGKNKQTGLRPMEIHPYRWLVPPLPPEGEVCSMFNIYLIRCEQHFGELAISHGQPTKRKASYWAG